MSTPKKTRGQKRALKSLKYWRKREGLAWTSLSPEEKTRIIREETMEPRDPFANPGVTMSRSRKNPSGAAMGIGLAAVAGLGLLVWYLMSKKSSPAPIINITPSAITGSSAGNDALTAAISAAAKDLSAK